MKKVMELIMRMKMTLLGIFMKKAPTIVTRSVDMGRADIFVQLKDGTMLQGFLRGNLEQDLSSMVTEFYLDLSDCTFVTLNSSEGNEKTFPTSDVKSVTLFRYPEVKLVTYEV